MSVSRPTRPRKLSKQDIRDSFSCGVLELDGWLEKNSLSNQQANSAITYVTCTGKQLVVGYYSITVGAVARDSTSNSFARDAPSEIPVIAVPRLAVDENFQKQGIGAGLLLDALERAYLLSNAVGAMAVLLHTRDSTSKDFYKKNLGGLQTPIDDNMIMVTTKCLHGQFKPRN